jgi:hypothetical protein
MHGLAQAQQPSHLLLHWSAGCHACPCVHPHTPSHAPHSVPPHPNPTRHRMHPPAAAGTPTHVRADSPPAQTALSDRHTARARACAAQQAPMADATPAPAPHRWSGAATRAAFIEFFEKKKEHVSWPSSAVSPCARPLDSAAQKLVRVLQLGVCVASPARPPASTPCLHPHPTNDRFPTCAEHARPHAHTPRRSSPTTIPRCSSPMRA